MNLIKHYITMSDCKNFPDASAFTSAECFLFFSALAFTC